MKLTRKEFLSSVFTAASGAAAAAFLVACGGSNGSGTPDAPPNCAANGTRVAIGGNHGHSMSVSAADVAAGASKTYDITGGASHSHNVTISGAAFAMLQSNTGVMTLSTAGGTDGHTHSITVNCA